MVVVGDRFPIRRAVIRSGCSITRHVFHASSPLACQWLVGRQTPSSATRLSEPTPPRPHHNCRDLHPQVMTVRFPPDGLNLVNRKCGEFLLGDSCAGGALTRPQRFVEASPIQYGTGVCRDHLFATVPPFLRQKWRGVVFGSQRPRNWRRYAYEPMWRGGCPPVFGAFET